MHDNDDTVKYLCFAKGGNVEFAIWHGGENLEKNLPCIAFSATPQVFRRIIGRMIAACIEADSAMPRIQMSPLELLPRSEAQ